MAATSESRLRQQSGLNRFLVSTLPSFAGQIALVGLLFVLYRFGRELAGDHVAQAVNNGSSLWDLERTLHLPSEASFQQLFLDRREVVSAANWYYVGAHFPVPILFLFSLYVWRRPVYQRTRNAMAAATALGLAIHIVYPLAPPRLVSNIGMVDTGNLFGPSPYRGAVKGAANQFAAMPSLHVGWAVLVGIIAWQIGPRWLRWAGVGHAIMTSIVVVVTANHYWIDGFVGASIVLIALWATKPRRNTAQDAKAAIGQVTAMRHERTSDQDVAAMTLGDEGNSAILEFEL